MATKIYCAAMDCEFCNEKGVCTAKSIALSAASVMTVYDGRQEFNKCKTFQKSQHAIEIEKWFKNHVDLFKQKTDSTMEDIKAGR